MSGSMWWSVFFIILAVTALPLVIAYISDRIRPWDIVRDQYTFHKLVAVVAVTGGGILVSIAWVIYGIILVIRG